MIIKTVVRMISLIFFFVDKLISVFSNEWILTAAHCVDGTGPAEIQVGYFFFGNHQQKCVMITIVIMPWLSSSFQFCSWSYLGQLDFLQYVCPITDAPGRTRLLGQRRTSENWNLTNHQFNTFTIFWLFGCWSISILSSRWGWTSPRSSCTPTTTPTPSIRTLPFSEWQIR